MKLPYILPLLATLACLACSKSTDPDTGSEPVFTGLHVTAEDGRQLRTYKSPADPLTESRSGSGGGGGVGVGITGYRFENPYPNPASTVNITFSVPASGSVTVRAAREPRSGESGTPISTLVGNIPAAKGLILSAVPLDAMLATGMHTISWRFSEDATQPSAYYRIFVSVRDTVLWHDVFMYRSPNELPEDLR